MKGDRSCPTGKLRFASKIEARQVVKDMERSVLRPDSVPRRVYECRQCWGWHLTSQPVMR